MKSLICIGPGLRGNGDLLQRYGTWENVVSRFEILV